MRKLLAILTVVFLVIVAMSAVVALTWSKGANISFKQKVALVYLEGPIIDSRKFVDEMKDYREDSSIKAIVLRVNSPGGGVAPSQEMFEAVRKTAAVKHTVVSMGAIAASGGYYVSAPSNRIFANPGTLTASIGVIMELPNIKGLMDKVGLKTEVIKSGRHKDIASAMREMTPEDRKILQGVIDDVYGQFLRDVSESRGLAVEELKPIADGRIMTGSQALEAGLVDELGSLDDAIMNAAEAVGIEGEPDVVTKKDAKSLFEYIDGKISGAVPELSPSISINYIARP